MMLTRSLFLIKVSQSSMTDGECYSASNHFIIYTCAGVHISFWPISLKTCGAHVREPHVNERGCAPESQGHSTGLCRLSVNPTQKVCSQNGLTQWFDSTSTKSLECQHNSEMRSKNDHLCVAVLGPFILLY